MLSGFEIAWLLYFRSWRVRYAITGALGVFVLGTLIGADYTIVSVVTVGTAWILGGYAGWYDMYEDLARRAREKP